MRTSVVLGTAVSVFLFAGVASADTINFHAAMDSDQEPTDPITVSGEGTADFTYDTVTHKLCGVVDYSKVSGPVTAGHIHTGAPGVNGPPWLNFAPPFDSPIGVVATLDATQQADIVDITKQPLYVNLHTTENSGGEIRGQLAVGGPGVNCNDEEDAGSSGSSGSSGASGNTSSGASGNTSSGASGTTSSSGTTDDAGTSSSSSGGSSSGGCSTSGDSSPMQTGIPVLLGVAIAGAIVARARSKKNKR